MKTNIHFDKIQNILLILAIINYLLYFKETLHYRTSPAIPEVCQIKLHQFEGYMTNFKFLHLSDLHFAKNSNRPPFSISQRQYLEERIDYALEEGFFAGGHSRAKSRELALFVRTEFRDVDAIIVTGDIATTGEYFDLQAALEFFEGDAEDENPVDVSLRTFKDKIILLPGNHDRYKQCPVDKKKLEFNENKSIFDPIRNFWEKFKNIKNLRNIFFLPGNKSFNEVFKSYWKNKVSSRIFMKENASVGIFTADFTLRDIEDCTSPRYLNMLAQGKVHDKVLQELIEKTKLYTDTKDLNKKIIIWAIHFPPQFPTLVYNPSKSFIQNCRIQAEWLVKKSTSQLLDSEKLISAAKECEVSFILTGHLHIPLHEQIESNIYMYGTGTATQYTFNEYLRDYHNIELDSPEVNCFHLLSMETHKTGFNVERTCYNFDMSFEENESSIRIKEGEKESDSFEYKDII